MERTARKRPAPVARVVGAMRSTGCIALAWMLCAVDCGPSPAVDAGVDGSPDTTAFDTAIDTHVDVPPADVGCDDFTGAYALSSICLPLSASLFGAMCVTQVGCEVTVAAGGLLFHGTATGSTVMLTAPNAPAEACTLAQTSSGVSVRCTNASQGTTCSGSGSEISVPTASRFCCDLFAQDCATGQRCTLVLAGDRGALIAACLPQLGSETDGVNCVRQMGMVGFDPCAPGLFCANTGQASRTTRVCHPLCSDTAHCGAGSVCYNLSGVETAGVCTPACTIGGSDCGTGTTCRYAPVLDASGNATFAGICDPLGTTAHGGMCTDSADCMAGDTCGFSRMGATCQTICDSSHPCPAGQNCVSSLPPGTPNPPGQGSCQ